MSEPRAAWRWRRVWPLGISGAGSSFACTAIVLRSVCVDSTTIVSVRATPSIERIVLMSRSSEVVFSVFTFRRTVCCPVT